MGRRRRRTNRVAQPQTIKAVPVANTPADDLRADDLRAIVADAVQGEISKALALPAGAVATPMSPAYLRSLAGRQPGSVYPSSPLPRDPYMDGVFGPGMPLVPAPIDPPLPSGRPAPRRYDAPNSWNLNTTTHRLTPWSILRDAADRNSVMRACIEVRKEEMVGLEWSFGIDPTRAQSLARRAGETTHAVTKRLQDRYGDVLERLNAWWTTPDRINNYSMPDWINAVLEDQLVLDALSIYPHVTYGGDLHSAEVIDATTIKPLLDHRAATPQPPYVAYQQILNGFPRGDYKASPSDMVDNTFTSVVYGNRPDIAGFRSPSTDALIYRVRSRRSFSPYGFSCVERALADVDLYMKRFGWLNAEFDDGVTPEMIVNVDAPLTPEQLRQYESVFNDDLSGQSRDRHRARFLPAGFMASYPNGVDAKFSSDLDYHVVRLICASFSVLPTTIGFTPNHGSIGNSGQQEGEANSQLIRATKPTAEWLRNLINDISATYLDMPPEITFRFHGIDDEDEAREKDLLTGFVSSGQYTMNEARDRLGMQRYSFPEADQPYLVTPTGPVFLNVAVQPLAVPGNLPSATPEQRAPRETDDGDGPPAPPPGGRGAAEEAETPPARAEKSVDGRHPVERAAQEARAYRRWIRRNGDSGRRFELHHITAADLDTYGIDPGTVKAAGVTDDDGSDTGKAYGPNGPGA